MSAIGLMALILVGMVGICLAVGFWARYLDRKDAEKLRKLD